MVELEFSALARQCLNRRIPTREQLQTQVLAWASERNEQAVKISWQFTTQHARQKLNSQYCKVNPANKKYRET